MRVQDTVSGSKTQYQDPRHSIRFQDTVTGIKTQYQGTKHSIRI